MDFVNNYMEHTMGFVSLYMTDMAVTSVYTVGKPSQPSFFCVSRGKSAYSDDRSERRAKRGK